MIFSGFYFIEIHSSCFLSLLLSMETNKVTDTLRILDLIRLHTRDTNTPAYESSVSFAMSSSDTNQNNPNANNNSPNTTSSLSGLNMNTAESGRHLSNAEGVNHHHQRYASHTMSTVAGLVNTNSLLISSSGALDYTQLKGTYLGSNMNAQLAGSTHGINQLSDQHQQAEDYTNMIKTLDFCYTDESQYKFGVIDAVNLCVTVVAYASHAARSNQMLIILDAVLPKYLQHIKAETCKLVTNLRANSLKTSSNNSEISQQAKVEFNAIQKIGVALRTLVNTSVFLSRTYAGPKTETTSSSTKKASLPNRKLIGNNKSVIMPDEDSMR